MMAEQNQVELELINKLINENTDPVDFILELQGYPQIQNNRDAVQLAMQIWQETHQKIDDLNQAA